MLRVAPPRRSIQYVVIALLALAVFAPALAGELVSDDVAMVRASSHGLLQAATRRFWDDSAGIGTLYASAYRPVSQVALALAVTIFDGDAGGLHLVNLLLHAAVSVLVLRWLTRRLREPGWAAFVGALIFAAHPIHGESVAWISGATDLWMTLFLLVGFELIEHRHAGLRVLASCSFALAALAKEPALVAPLLCWADAYARALTPEERRARVSWCGLGAAGALALIFLTRPAAHDLAAVSGVDPKQTLSALGYYAKMLLAPIALTFQAAPYRRVGHTLALPTWSLVLGAACCVMLVFLTLRARATRRTLADVLWIVSPLAPVVMLQPGVLSDRFLYAPSLGLVALLARGLEHLEHSPRVRGGQWAALALVALMLCIARSQQTARIFENDETLWSSQVAAYPEHFKAIDALGERHLARGQRHAARVLFERGLALAHDVDHRHYVLHYLAHLTLFEANGQPAWDPRQHNGRAHCDELLSARRLSYSHNALTITTQLTTVERDTLLGADPDLMLLPCIRILLATGEPERAAALAQQALRIVPAHAAARELLVLALARAGRFEAASAALQAAPSALRARVDTAQSLAAAQRATDDPRERALLAARASLTLGDTQGARAKLAPALRDPTDHEAVHLLAQSFVSEGRFDLAEQTLQEAANLAPADPYWTSAFESLARARELLAANPPQ